MRHLCTRAHQLLIVNTHRIITSYQFWVASVCGDHLLWIYNEPSTAPKQKHTILDSVYWMRDAVQLVCTKTTWPMQFVHQKHLKGVPSVSSKQDYRWYLVQNISYTESQTAISLKLLVYLRQLESTWSRLCQDNLHLLTWECQTGIFFFSLDFQITSDP